MRKFIIPSRDKIKNWNSFFSSSYLDEARQFELMEKLITLSMAFAYDGVNKNNEFVELFETTLSMAVKLAHTGVIYEEDTDAVAETAYEFCVSLVNYLKELDILSRVPTVMSFEGFVGMNILIKVLGAGEPYLNKMEEQACRSG